MAEELTPEEIDALLARQRKRRKRMYQRSLTDLGRVLSNEDGIRRLLDISDDEWQGAQAQDGEGEDAGLTGGN